VRLGSPETGMPMAEDFEMRWRLQQVAAYRDLCRRVRRSGRENIVFAAIMVVLAYLTWNGANPLITVFYCILIGAELAVGLFKWMFPSAEGHLLDALVLLIFAALNIGFQFIVPQPRGGPQLVIILFGLLLLGQSINLFKYYGHVRRLFAERPSAEHIAWFNDLVKEIKSADPQLDELALDLPTTPHWKAKLLGSTAFFVAAQGDMALICGPDEFEIRRERVDHGIGRRKAILTVYDVPYPEFQIGDVSWSNYQKWRAAHPLPDTSSSAVSERG
jgi:hypothetical protein